MFELGGGHTALGGRIIRLAVAGSAAFDKGVLVWVPWASYTEEELRIVA